MSYDNVLSKGLGIVLIDSYSFGRIVIDGKTYTSDIILYPDRVDDGWWRKSGHLLQKEDLKDIIEYNPEILIVGTGTYGLMNVLDETKQFLELKEIELKAEETGKACKIYNELKEKRKVVAALHLTC
ncbi:MAG: Mth938-like domain-containing protein [Thermoplasmatales archaeon]|nr:MAG: Mth938-like domain-containing protein [Thermoplasmatales archaeon]